MNNNVIRLNETDVLDRLETITEKNRLRTVRDNDYGRIETSSSTTRDSSKYSVIEYDELGNVIFEDYSKLIELIENEIIPNNIKDTHIRDPKTNEKIVAKTIQGNVITKYRVSEKEQKYIIEYLASKGILVRGTDSSIDSEFEGYQYISTYKNINLPKGFSILENHKAIIEYQEFKDKLKKIPDNHPKKKKLEEQLFAARNKIIEGNMRLVKFIIRKQMPKSINPSDYDDIEQIAYEVLVKYIENFQVEQGYAFSTYITSSLMRTVLREYGKYNAFHIPEYIRYTIPSILSLQNNFEKINGRKPTIEEIATELEIPERVVKKAIEAQMILNPESYEDYYEKLEEEQLYEDKNDDDSEYYYDEMDFYLTERSAENIVYDQELREQIAYLLEYSLTSREKEVLIHSFGFEGEQMKTHEEIGKILNLPKERIRQIENKAIRKLRHPQRYKYIKGLEHTDENISRPKRG